MTDIPDLRIGIAGAGAMGCKFGAGFISAGYKVCFYEKYSSTVSHIASHGLKVSSEDGSSFHINLNISTLPEILKDSDIVFLFVKSFDTATVVAEIRGFCSPETVIVSFQNGLGNYEAIAESFSFDKIVYGSTSEGAAKSFAGHLVSGGDGVSLFGGTGKDEIILVDSILKSSGFKSKVTPDPAFTVWKKAVINSAINPPGAMLGLTNGELAKNPYALELMRMISLESAAAASVSGVEMDPDKIFDEIVEICHKTKGNRCSMLQDIENRRKTEIDSINGMIIETAERAGLNAVCNKTVFFIIKALEKRGKS